ncbi:YbhB/YbcL family Raf kinase inhibitor-like protein [Radicibacter daui]|uniref:YbhB/YbcL family Raf kinase inhibitor-like protein n=1 Tax=Radicibacter daui TaxID=3064829 RepID=UPI0040469040
MTRIFRPVPLMVAAALLAATGTSASAADFTLSSPDLQDGHFASSQVMSAAFGFGCNGDNISPALNWSGVPAGTKSLLLTIWDKDAPTGVGFTHWIVANIPPTATGLKPGAGSGAATLPEGALQTRTDLGKPGYLGPCPPVGTTHDYIFTLTALKVEKLPVDETATPALIGFMAGQNKLASTSFTGRYSH